MTKRQDGPFALDAMVHGNRIPLVNEHAETITNPSQSAWRESGPLLVAVFLGISRIWVGGYHFGIGDHAWQLPTIEALSAGRFAADYAFGNPVDLSIYFRLLGLVSRYLSLEALMFAGYAAVSVATAVALYRLAERMLGSRSAGVVAVLLLMTKHNVIAGATTWDALLVPRTAAMPFLLLSWLGVLEQKWVRSGVFMGVAFALHPLTGMHGGAIAFAAILLTRPAWTKALGKFALAVSPFAAFAVWYGWDGGAPVFAAGDAWYRAMMIRNLHHVAPGRLLLMSALLVYGVWLSRSLSEAGQRRCLLRAAVAATAIVFLASAAFLIYGRLRGLEYPAGALMTPPILAILQPLRISGPFGILVLVATAGVLERAMRCGALGMLTAVAACAALFFGYWVVGALLLAAALAFSAGTAALAPGGILLLVGALALAGTRYQVLMVIVTAAVAAAFAAAFALKKLGIEKPAGALAALVVVLGIVPAGWAPRTAGTLGATVTPEELQRYERPVLLEVSRDPAFVEASNWAARNVAGDEVIIVPPWWEGFRIASGAAVYGTYRDGTLVFFNETLSGQWLERMALLDVPLRPGGGSRFPYAGRHFYNSLSQENLLEAASRHQARYVVRLGGDMPGLERVYSGQFVAIYEITPSGGASE